MEKQGEQKWCNRHRSPAEPLAGIVGLEVGKNQNEI